MSTMRQLFVVVVLAATLTNAEFDISQRIFMKADVPMLSEELIQFINRINTTWTAGRNFAEDTPERHIVGLLGVKMPERNGIHIVVDEVDSSLPKTFDARKKWPQCLSISEIRDQGACGSSWAIAVADSISDRICIASGGQQQVEVSADELLSCCTDCGFGCGGGYIKYAWFYYLNSGLVSGSAGKFRKGCKPYLIPDCEHHTTGRNASCGDIQPTPACAKLCQSGYNVNYHADKHFAKEVYTIFGSVTQIMQNINRGGPVQAQLTVYADFLQYKSGVYRRHSDKVLGIQAIRIIGWGEENGDQYWLCANSWGTEWGDGGYFKILRNNNECGIEYNAHVAVPKFPQPSKTNSKTNSKTVMGVLSWLMGLAKSPFK